MRKTNKQMYEKYKDQLTWLKIFQEKCWPEKSESNQHGIDSVTDWFPVTKELPAGAMENRVYGLVTYGVRFGKIQ